MDKQSEDTQVKLELGSMEAETTEKELQIDILGFYVYFVITLYSDMEKQLNNTCVYYDKVANAIFQGPNTRLRQSKHGNTYVHLKDILKFAEFQDDEKSRHRHFFDFIKYLNE